MKKSLWKQFLCLMFSVIMAVALGVIIGGKKAQAASPNTFKIEKDGSVNSLPAFGMSKGDSKTFETANTSDKIMKVTYSFSWTEGSNSTSTYLTLQVAGSSLTKSMLNDGTNKNVVYLYPGERNSVKMEYDSFAYKSCTVTLTARAEVLNDTITVPGTSPATATSVSFGKKFNGLYTGSGNAEKQYYKMTLEDKYYINTAYNFYVRSGYGHQPIVTIYNTSGKEFLKIDTLKTVDAKWLEKGTYIIEVDIKEADEYMGGGFLYNLQFGGRKWIHATGIRFSPASITVNGSKTSYTSFEVVAKTIPENSDDQLLNVEKKFNCLIGDYTNLCKNSQVIKGGFYDVLAVGRQHCFTVTTTNGIKADFYVTITIPNASKPTKAITTYNSAKITFAYPRREGTKIHLQQKKGKKWVTVKTVIPSNTVSPSSEVTVKNLKALTSYQFRTIIQSGNSYGKASPAITVKTGSKIKPKIKSIKISEFKKVNVPRKYHTGHWNGSTWIRGYYTGGYSYTRYKVTVTLKKNVPKTNGLYINSILAKKKGTSYSVYLTGGKKGSKKTIKIQTVRDKKQGSGIGPTVKRKITI